MSANVSTKCKSFNQLKKYQLFVTVTVMDGGWVVRYACISGPFKNYSS